MNPPPRYELPGPALSDFELEVVPGLEDFVIQEMKNRCPQGMTIHRLPTEGRLTVHIEHGIGLLNDLRPVTAVYASQHFEVPRPRALLGQQHFDRLTSLAAAIVSTHPEGTFKTVRVSAAGADSSVFSRLKQQLAAALTLTLSEGPADLLVIIRPSPRSGGGRWQALVRTTPRPLSARPWRVCDMPGALNSTVAHAMVSLAQPHPNESFVNLACGSGTLIVERLELGPARSVVGYDVETRALECARANLKASRHDSEVGLFLHDATQLPLPSASVDTLVADLPYAMLISTGGANAKLYPRLLTEASRIARPGARFIVVTTQRRLMTDVLTQLQDQWQCLSTIPLKISYQRGYIRPAIYVLSRRPHR